MLSVYGVTKMHSLQFASRDKRLCSCLDSREFKLEGEDTWQNGMITPLANALW